MQMYYTRVFRLMNSIRLDATQSVGRVVHYSGRRDTDWMQGEDGKMRCYVSAKVSSVNFVKCMPRCMIRAI